MRPTLNLNNAGLSLVEVLVALGIFIMLIGSITSILIISSRSKNIVFEQLLTQSQGRKVVQDFVNELRSANVSSIGAYPLAEVAPNEIIFYSNIDSDTYRERIRYFLSNNNLIKGIIKPSGNPLQYLANQEVTSTVANSINNGSDPLFSYYDQNYTGTSTPLVNPNVTAVRMVKIKFQLERNPNFSPAALNLEGQAELRNLKNN